MSYERLNLKTGQVITEEVFAHLEDGIEGAANAVLMTPILYADLVTLRDAGQLKAGMFYRITDYVTTTIQENTQSAGHAFDVIVIAVDSKTLSEEARAIVHEGDTYFTEAGANLAAWKVWYALDNDSARFAWADAENGKGVIYRLIDEWNNDVPYDFKNIVYIFNKSFMYNQWGKDSEFIRDSSIDKVINGTQYYGYVTDNLPNAWSEGKCWVADAEVTANSQLYKEDGSVISYGGTIYNISNAEYEFFTFNEGELNDFSLEGEFCYGNTIMPWAEGLNRIVFKNDKTYEYQGKYRHNCYNNSFGSSCHNNSFGNNCYNNSFGDGCNRNSFGNDCNYNSFGNDCYSNSFGNGCSYNSFGNDCYSNSFGNNCYNNSLGYNCNSNSFGNDCNSNSFGNNCVSNSFGNYCSSNSFGEGCNYNSFQNAESEVAAYCKNNSFGNACSSVILQNDATASSSQNIQNYRIANGMTGTVEVTRGLAYETTIAKATDGTIKQFNLADLAN